MRELAVHYCPRCGFYAYYQISKHAVCPKCDVKMNTLDMRYQTFMDLDCSQRDRLLTDRILADRPFITRLLKPHQEHNAREIIALLANQIESMESEISRLKEDNKKQKDTVEWMHKMIWDLVKKQHLIEESDPTTADNSISKPTTE